MKSKKQYNGVKIFMLYWETAWPTEPKIPAYVANEATPALQRKLNNQH